MENRQSKDKSITFEEVKQLFVDSIDEADTIADIFKIVIEKAYEKGLKDKSNE